MIMYHADKEMGKATIALSNFKLLAAGGMTVGTSAGTWVDGLGIEMPAL
jgi:hypothetical protein